MVELASWVMMKINWHSSNTRDTQSCLGDVSPGSLLLAARLPLAGRQRTKPLSVSWLDWHPHFPLPPGRESKGQGSEGDCSLSFSQESNAPCFSRCSVHSPPYSSLGQDGLMRPLITHSINNKIVLSFIVHLPGPPHPQQEAISPPLNSHRPHPGLPGAQDCELVFLPSWNCWRVVSTLVSFAPVSRMQSTVPGTQERLHEHFVCT